MKECPTCHIKVDTNRVTCPLCYSVLDEVTSHEVGQSYPKNESKKGRNIIEKCFILASILSFIGSMIGNWITYHHGMENFWSLIVALGILFGWVLAKYCILGNGILSNRIFSQTVLMVILLLCIEGFALNKHTFWWSTNYVIPLLWCGVLSSILLLTFIQKHIFVDSIMGLLIMSLLGFIPIVLHLTTSLIPLLWPSLTCACISITVLCTMLVFHFPECKSELQKRLHI